MIIMTVKRPRIHFATLTTIASALCCFFLVFGLVHEPFETAMSTSISSSVKSGADRIAYLEQWGWTVEEIPLATQVLLIPEILDSTYTNYISMQEAQGFPSLMDFRGEEVIQYRYAVTNYPTGEEGVQLNLLCFDNRVIAGEVLSPEVDGFIHGLAKP